MGIQQLELIFRLRESVTEIVLALTKEKPGVRPGFSIRSTVAPRGSLF
jgi:hypothetical protein